MTVAEGCAVPGTSGAGAGGRGSAILAPLTPVAALTEDHRSVAQDRELPLLWGQWGGVIAIIAMLMSLVVGLTLTVGAIPL